MSRSAIAFILGWIVAMPGSGAGESPVRQRQVLPGQPAIPQVPGNNRYTAPKGDGPVVVLFDEGVGPLFTELNNDGGGDSGTITREDRDVFAGVEAIRVTPVQRYRSTIPGWGYRIVEKPERAGEFRFLRLALKKSGGSGLMLQLHDPQKLWNLRLIAGNNVFGWLPAVSVAARPPAEWQVITHDLFKEFGTLTITGFALSPLDGTAGLFDHMLLGRTIEDLDRATRAALGKVPPVEPLAGAERDTMWTDLMGGDRPRATAAIQTFLTSAPDCVAFIGEKLAAANANNEQSVRIRKLITDLDDEDFDTREAATERLIQLGAPALDPVRAVASSDASAEVQFRAKLILKKLGAEGTSLSTAGRMSRVARVLERADTKEARTLLTRMAAGEFGFDAVSDARAALARLAKKP